MAERKPQAPNLREVIMPDCCGVCENYVMWGELYDDSPPECEKYNTVHRSIFGFDSLCDEFERDTSYPVRETNG